MNVFCGTCESEHAMGDRFMWLVQQVKRDTPPPIYQELMEFAELLHDHEELKDLADE